MKKRLFIVCLVALLTQGFAGAQTLTSMRVPHGSFEQWTSHPGYSVTIMGIIPVAVYNSFSTPTGWDYPAYPVNETFSLMNQNININTDLPLIKASQVTGTVPDSSTAVKLESFMLSDIVSPAVYSWASGSLDSTLTTMVFPSVLTTGAVDIDHFLPLMTGLISNMDSLAAVFASLADVDVNYYFSGGLALDGFLPNYLTGSYKYMSADSGDNGGVLLLGTRYNSTLNKREVVGGGVNIALTDCTDFTPFTVNYLSLHEYDASYPEQTPDSLIVMLVSSASVNRQQGSYLCVDSLALWHVELPEPEPDTCAWITAIAIDSTDLSYTDDNLVAGYAASWLSTFDPDAWEVEYGLEGFVPGTGNGDTVLTSTLALEPLLPGTEYELRVRTLCSDSIHGPWESLTFHTRDTIPIDTTIIDTTIVDTTIIDTTIIDTTGIDTTGISNRSPLTANLLISPNPAEGRCVVNLPGIGEAVLKLFSSDGHLVERLVFRGTPVTLLSPSPGVYLLQVATPDGTLSRKIISR